MSAHEHEQFSVNKIFWTLFILTAVEVAWGKWIPYEQKLLLWGGLSLSLLGTLRVISPHPQVGTMQYLTAKDNESLLIQ